MEEYRIAEYPINMFCLEVKQEVGETIVLSRLIPGTDFCWCIVDFQGEVLPIGTQPSISNSLGSLIAAQQLAQEIIKKRTQVAHLSFPIIHPIK